MKVAVVGSRSIGLRHYQFLCNKMPVGASTIISGGAKGADVLAKLYASENNLFYDEILPDYYQFGRAAPIRRNEEIISRADYVIVLWDGESRGSAFVIKHCIDSGTPVHVFICH